MNCRTTRFAALLMLAAGLAGSLPSSAQAAEDAGICKRPSGFSDHDAITDVLARYAHYADAKDDAGWAGLFTPDGVWESVGVGRFEGTDVLRRFMKSTPVGGRHITADYVISIAGTRATARSHVLNIRFDQQRPVIGGIGIYEDELVCTSEGWKLKSRKYVRAAAPPPAKPE